jgi:hypothetical protein
MVGRGARDYIVFKDIYIHIYIYIYRMVGRGARDYIVFKDKGCETGTISIQEKVIN